MQALLEMGTAAQRAGTALILFVDELQYVEAQLAALITALHRCAHGAFQSLAGRACRNSGSQSQIYAERLFDFPRLVRSPSCRKTAIAKPAAAKSKWTGKPSDSEGRLTAISLAGVGQACLGQLPLHIPPRDVDRAQRSGSALDEFFASDSTS